MATSLLKRTPLYDEHLKLKARMVPFGGWEMPVQYEGVLQEHKAVRQAAGIFDVCHMGEIIVSGANALSWLNSMTTNDVSKIADGGCQYNLLLFENGGVVDDIIIYRHAVTHFLIVVNASNIQKDFDWLLSRQTTGVEIVNESDAWGLIALQGPKSVEILKKALAKDFSALGYYHFTKGSCQGSETWVSRTGYTGEDGFELFLAAEEVAQAWRCLLQEGAALGLKPAGLGARDTLRLEAAYPLYGHEISAAINPFEAGLGWAVKMDKGDFVGKAVLAAVRHAGVKRRRIGFELEEAGIARQGYGVFDGEQQIGIVTSGTHSPTLGKPIGLALVDTGVGEVGRKILLDIRGKKKKGVIVKTPFYKR